ncbi:MAG TPA: hypothetical protein PLD62_10615 [Candidatus Cloacimonadota bacterium]|nr:hypothetical protein [Candidatus Cloacimonadota bacterium]
MNKFTALLKKDYFVNRKSLLTPFWITAVFYILIILFLTIGYFKGDLNFGDLRFEGENIPMPGLAFLINIGLLTLPGFIALLFTITITQGALNEDLRRNCELFHRSQPVSYWLRSLSKFTIRIGGNWAVLLIIAIFNFIIVNIIVAFLGQFHPGAALSGMMLSFLGFAKITLIIGSMTFFLSSVFKDKAFFTGLGILLGVHFLFLILNALLGWKLPLPFNYFIDLTKSGYELDIHGEQELANFHGMAKEMWKYAIWNVKTLWQILVSGVFFALATLIYNSKEVK